MKAGHRSSPATASHGTLGELPDPGSETPDVRSELSGRDARKSGVESTSLQESACAASEHRDPASSTRNRTHPEVDPQESIASPWDNRADPEVQNEEPRTAPIDAEHPAECYAGLFSGPPMTAPVIAMEWKPSEPLLWELDAQGRDPRRRSRAPCAQADIADRDSSGLPVNRSPEIRTAANAVIGMIRLLLHSRLTDEQRRYAEAALISAESIPVMVSDVPDLPKVETDRPSLPHLSDQAVVPRFGGVSILIVEDKKLNQEVVRRMLEKTGAAVGVANDGAEAVVMIESRHFDLVLMDLQMPVMDGFEATRRIRERFRELPVIALSAATTKEDRDHVRAAGMNAHLAKPIDSRALYRTLSDWLPPSSAGPEPEPEPKSVGQSRGLPTRLDGFDLELGRRYADGDDAFYHELLLRFRDQLATDLRDIVERLEAGEDSSTAVRMVHTLKGTAGTVGAVRLELIATTLDRVLREGVGVSAEMLHALREALEQAQSQLERLAPQAAETRKSVPHALAAASDSSPSTSAAACAPEPLWPHPERPTLLVVDDQAIEVRILQQIFRVDCDVLTASCGAEALAQCRRALPDLILLDVMMPDMDGLAVCRALKQDPETAEIPILFVTAQTDAVDQAQALNAGAVDFISKPAKPAVVRARVRTHLTLKAQSDILRGMAYMDGLTGIANRRCFDERLKAEWNRAQRTDTPLALLMLDVDHFKRYNDRHGHQAGDACLQAVARALMAVPCRGHDLVARYGGEELVCLLPGCDLDTAVNKAECFRVAVADLGIPHLDSPVGDHVTVSIGAAVLTPGDQTEPATLLDLADEQLYLAKRAGRNSVAPLFRG
jgi:diguanylate cyclase (GGDEF)-like protein